MAGDTRRPAIVFKPGYSKNKPFSLGRSPGPKLAVQTSHSDNKLYVHCTAAEIEEDSILGPTRQVGGTA